MGCYCSYLLPKQGGGTSQIQVYEDVGCPVEDLQKISHEIDFSQVGTSTWRRHLLTISDLVDDETKRRYLNKPSNITNNEFYRLMLFQQQLQEDFDVVDFSHKMGLLSFSFVRHPFERYVHRLNSYAKYRMPRLVDY